MQNSKETLPEYIRRQLAVMNAAAEKTREERWAARDGLVEALIENADKLADALEDMDWLQANLPKVGIGTPQLQDATWWIFGDGDGPENDSYGPTLHAVIAAARKAQTEKQGNKS